jgi:hypothetical protein
MHLKFTLICFIVLFCHCARAQYPSKVKIAISQTLTNRQELIKALNYFYGTKDSLKIRSVNFLVANMPLQYSQNYYWADEQGHQIAYNELRYSTFNEAVLALDALKKKYGRLHPVPYLYRDIDSVTADMLITNITQATEKYRERKKESGITEEEFFEYVLPYRASVEPLNDWRKVYQARFENELNPDATPDAQEKQLKGDINARFTNTYGTEKRIEPLPRLSALQILLRGKGLCEDIADMTVFIARSHGIPASVDNIPFWGTTGGEHFLNYLKLDARHTHFDTVLDSLGREPAKVLRTTYSAQPDAIASWLDTAYIPRGFLRIKNYKDVTSEYWPVDDFSCSLSRPGNRNTGVVYLCVYNAGDWKAVWYGRTKGDKASFSQMSKGVVYLPVYYEKGKLVPAAWPYALGYHNKAVLKPDTVHPHSITLEQEDNYLKYRPGKKYRLVYWNNGWQKIGEQTAPEGCTRLVFDKVPVNALLLLIPEYSQRKERPFIIQENGQRTWW